MDTIISKVTSQGQTSVPAEVRKLLGLASGSILEWTPVPEGIMVKRRGEYTFDEIHKRLFPNGAPKRVSIAEMKRGVGRGIAEKYERVMRENEEAED